MRSKTAAEAAAAAAATAAAVAVAATAAAAEAAASAAAVAAAAAGAAASASAASAAAAAKMKNVFGIFRAPVSVVKEFALFSRACWQKERFQSQGHHTNHLGEFLGSQNMFQWLSYIVFWRSRRDDFLALSEASSSSAASRYSRKSSHPRTGILTTQHVSFHFGVTSCGW
jgi:nucleoid-associated protein YgaU